MSDFLLTQIINYGAPLFGFILFLGALGIPLGASIMVIAAGAFSQQGFLNWTSATALGFIGAVAGDAVSFGMGYYAKAWVDKQFGKSKAWKNAQNSFASRTGTAVYLTRFLITALAIPTNFIAGGSGFKFSNFMAFDIAGGPPGSFSMAGLAIGSEANGNSSAISSITLAALCWAL